jgi:hypothetical protein
MLYTEDDHITISDPEDYDREIKNCILCKGIIKTRKCGQEIEILNFNVTNYGEGTIHHCPHLNHNPNRNRQSQLGSTS